jgi:hypothetical protein
MALQKLQSLQPTKFELLIVPTRAAAQRRLVSLHTADIPGNPDSTHHVTNTVQITIANRNSGRAAIACIPSLVALSKTSRLVTSAVRSEAQQDYFPKLDAKH